MSTKLKTVIVGNGCIGKGIADRLKAKGNDVFTIDAAAGKADYTADVTDAARMAEAMKAANAAMGGINALVNCFGAAYEAAVAGIDQKQVEEAFGLAVGGVINTVNAAVPYLKENPEGARVLNISGVRGRVATGNHALEAAIAGAVTSLTREQAVDLAPLRIYVNSLSPWLIEENPGMTEAQLKKVVTMSLMDRPMNAADVAEVAEFMIGPGAITLNAFDLVLDGGMSIHRVKSEFSNFDSKGSDYYR